MRLPLSCAIVAVICLAGCRGHELNTAPVRGTVTLDGKPLARGTVIFTPTQGRSANGRIQSDGSFNLSTYGDGDGAIVGSHKIAVYEAPVEREPGKFDVDRPQLPAKIPELYRDPDRSGLSFDVQADEENVASLELQSR